jgi:hypothetical protein
LSWLIVDDTVWHEIVDTHPIGRIFFIYLFSYPMYSTPWGGLIRFAFRQ